MLRLWMAISPKGAAPLRRPDGPGRSSEASFHVALDESIAGRHYLISLSPPDLARASVQETDGAFRVRVGKLHPEASFDDERFEDDAYITVDKETGGVGIRVPPTCQTKLFHTLRSGVLYISSDLRLLVEPDMSLDERGVYSLFQFGAVVPPISLWKEIGRLTTGKHTLISPDSLTMREEPVEFWDSPPVEPKPPRDSRDRLRILQGEVDRALIRLCPDTRPALLFSGGVDSGLLAARAAGLGWKDALLVNYSRGAGDGEAELADAMARHLGLRLARVTESPHAWDRALRSIGEWSHPFGDYATFTSFHLVRHILEIQTESRTIVDGAGADGLFGFFHKLSRWRALYRIPSILRRVLSAAYGPGRFWTGRGRFARRMAWSRISCQMDYLLASMSAENPLCGIAYHAPRAIRKEVQQILLQWVSETFPYDDPLNRARWLDVLHNLNELMAQKAAGLLQGNSTDIVFPFLDPGVVRLALQEVAHWPQSENKGVVKELLASHVPSDMVYRPKSGPEPPIIDQFALPSTIEAFQECVLDSKNPLLPFMEERFVRRIIQQACRRRPLAHFTHNFLWTLLFTSLWIRQVLPEGPKAPR